MRQLIRKNALGSPLQRPFANNHSSAVPHAIPGPISTPPAGTVGDFMQRVQKTDVFRAISSYYHEYGPVVFHDLNGDKQVWIYEPAHMMQVHRLEGSPPRAIAVHMWPFRKYWQEKFGCLYVWASDSSDWQRLRSIMQKDIFTPLAADSYLPLMDAPARGASAVADRVPFEKLAALASADLFFATMFGVSSKCCESPLGGKGDPLDLKFIESSIEVSAASVELMTLGENKEVWKRWETAFEFILERTSYYIQRFKAASSAYPVDPYFLRVNKENALTENELSAAAAAILFAGVDSTGIYLSWSIINLAFNPDAQEKLYQELKTVLGDGPLEAGHLKHLPYLNAVLRETHRLTPPAHSVYLRSLRVPVEIAGYTIPADTKIVMYPHTIQNHEKYIPDCDKFSPDRWMKEKVEQRKGTISEVIDHPLLSEPFGFGARKCLGFRVAKAELKSMIARFVRDWKISAVPGSKFIPTGMGLTNPTPFPQLLFERRK